MLRRSAPDSPGSGEEKFVGPKDEAWTDIRADEPEGTMLRFGEGLRVVLAARKDTPAPPSERRKRKRIG